MTGARTFLRRSTRTCPGADRCFVVTLILSGIESLHQTRGDSEQLQDQLDEFREYYNTRRPHRSLDHNRTPAAAYATRPKATPSADDRGREHNRIRRDVVDEDGKITLRHDGKMHHIGIGRTHARTPVLMLIQDLEIHVINAATGQILRELTLDPHRDYQPHNKESPDP